MSKGISGFDNRGDFELALEPVTGARWWRMTLPKLTGLPGDADRNWPRALLRGQKGYLWEPGRNTAVCFATGGIPRTDHDVPDDDCGCGFWAYWDLQEHDIGGSTGAFTENICGIIQGTGRVLVGERGFRSQYAKIVALYLPFQIMPGNCGVPGCMAHDVVTDVYEAEKDRAEAWMAVIGDRLAQMYPDATVYETRDAMLAAWPPDTAYRPLVPEPVRFSSAFYTASWRSGAGFMPWTAADWAAHPRAVRIDQDPAGTLPGNRCMYPSLHVPSCACGTNWYKIL